MEGACNRPRVARHPDKRNLEYLWIIPRDIKGVGLSATIRSNQEQIRSELGGLVSPVRIDEVFGSPQLRVTLPDETLSAVGGFKKEHVAFGQGFHQGRSQGSESLSRSWHIRLEGLVTSWHRLGIL